VAPDAEMPGTTVPEGTAAETGRSRPPKEGRLPVSEMAADRSGALSPFGDDQTFPLPFDDLTYTPAITP
jgi:hypothetical protein